MEDLGIEGCTQGTLRSKHGYDIATYRWAPEAGAAGARGVVVLVHGIHAHAVYDFLALDAGGLRRGVDGSLVGALVGAGFAVAAYDHLGHGLSGGERAYFESLDDVRDVLLEVVDGVKADYPTLPLALCGMSMGATTIVLASLRREVADAVVLLSPAVHTPKDMLGLYGRVLRAINRPLSKLVPKLKVIQLPLPADPAIREAYQRDPLNYQGAMRVRVGAEFIRVYALFDKVANFHFRNALLIAGTADAIVDPAGIEKFFQRVDAHDKVLDLLDDSTHELLHDKGADKVYARIVEWLSTVFSKSAE